MGNKVVSFILERARDGTAISVDEGQMLCGLIKHVYNYPALQPFLTAINAFAPSWERFVRLSDVLDPDQKLGPLLEEVERGNFSMFDAKTLYSVIEVVWTEEAVRKFDVMAILQRELDGAGDH